MAGIKRHALIDLITVHSQIYAMKFGQMQNEFNLVKPVVSFYRWLKRSRDKENST